MPLKMTSRSSTLSAISQMGNKIGSTVENTEYRGRVFLEYINHRIIVDQQAAHAKIMLRLHIEQRIPFRQ